MDCVFCQIVSGSLAAEVVLDEPQVVGFLDVRPLFPGHTLVVPRLHVEVLWELDEALRNTVFGAVSRVAVAVRAATGAEGIFVANNNIVSQSVPHLHVHVVPRNKKDGLRGFFWPRGKYADGEAAAVADNIRRQLGGV